MSITFSKSIHLTVFMLNELFCLYSDIVTLLLFTCSKNLFVNIILYLWVCCPKARGKELIDMVFYLFLFSQKILNVAANKTFGDVIAAHLYDSIVKEFSYAVHHFSVQTSSFCSSYMQVTKIFPMGNRGVQFDSVRSWGITVCMGRLGGKVAHSRFSIHDYGITKSYSNWNIS